MVRKLIFVCVFAFFLVAGLSGQHVYDLDDIMYRDLEIWETRGLTDRLPLHRPFPPQVLRDALRQVVARAHGVERERAQEYLSALEINFQMDGAFGARSRLRVDGDETSVYAEGTGMVTGSWWLDPSVYVAGRFRVYGIYRPEGELLSAMERSPLDFFEDMADVGRLDLRFMQNSYFAAGNETMYFHSGIMRSSFGPFWGDNVVLSPEAPQSGLFGFTWRLPLLTFSTSLMHLSATNHLGVGQYPNKHFIFQSFTFYPFDWLTFSFFEGVVWGDRFEPLYLMPFKELFYAQSMTGFPDNSMIGLGADFRLPMGVRLPFLLYLDDLHLNDMLRLRFDTKIKLALQAGASWAPDPDLLGTGLLRRVGLEYTLVTPYMYTHRSADVNAANAGDLPNFTNYTHRGIGLGTDLPPNSDRWSLRLDLQPIRDLQIGLHGSFIRHGNASEGQVIDSWIRDNSIEGTIFDDGSGTFWEETRFLTQSVLEMTVKTGLDLRLYLGFEEGPAVFTLGYIFEHIMNYNYVRDDSRTNHYLEASLTIWPRF